MVKVEFSWKLGNYWSMSRFTDTALKLTLLACLALFTAKYSYEEHQVLHLLAIGAVGIVI
jgi:hypothetical protein